MSFFQRLAAETAAERTALLATPQIRDGLAGRISLATYVAYLTEAYHHVKHTVPLMLEARARMDADHAPFVAALDEYIAEETGHEAWILNDIRACGADPALARDGQPSPQTQAMVDEAYRVIREVNPMGFFGMVLVLEGTSVSLATQGAEAVRESLGLPHAAFSYLTSHGALDQSHMAFFQGLMEQVTRPADQQAIIDTARSIFRLFADLFRAIPHEGSLAHAV
ncbi:MAG: iron-containing redox enzyme family protein [Caulobacteraceae bacterium]|nr:iron-containing redox enzyme family protein [Caulobacteraceae bacterium]